MKLFPWKLRETVGMGIVVAMLLYLNFGCIKILKADVSDHTQAQRNRSPRDGSTDMSSCCCTGGDSAEMDLIRGCVCQINSNIGGLSTDLDGLETCCENLTSIVEESFAETWTAIDSINGGSETCCENLTSIVEESFSETWTAIDGLESCCEELTSFVRSNFIETWTAIASISDKTSSHYENLISIVEESFSETWTAIDAINGSSETCCENLTSIVEESFAETWTAIAAINGSSESCCENLTSIVEESFSETWTAIAGLESCCENLTSIIEESFSGTWTAIAAVGGDGCAVTPITNADAVGDTITLGSPGHYCAAENLIYKIVISSDDVSFDLNLYDITRSSANDNIITVNSNLESITILNGTIINSAVSPGTGCGILVDSGSSNVSIRSVKVFSCHTGIKLDGEDGSEILNCEITSCDLSSNVIGLLMNWSNKNIVTNCWANGCTQAGFELSLSKCNVVSECQALGTEGEASVAAFKSDSGQMNLFQNCTAKGTKTSAWEFCNKSYGFLLTGTETKTKIVDCIVNETDVTSTVSAVSYGINLEPVLLDVAALLDEKCTGTGYLDGNGFSVAWAPNAEYIATGDDDDKLKIFRCYNMMLYQVTEVNVANTTFFTVDWSPNGRYVVSGSDTGHELRIWKFEDSTLTIVDTVPDPSKDVFTVAFSCDGRYVAGGDNNKKLQYYCFDGSNLSHVAENTSPLGNIKSISWSPNSKTIVKLLATGETVDGGKARVRVFSFDGLNSTEITNDDSLTTDINFIDWSPDGMHIAVAANSEPIRVFSFNGESLDVVATSTTTDGNSLGVSWSPGGKYLAGTYSSGRTRVFEFDGTSLNEVAQTHVSGANAVGCVDWSSNGKCIVTVDDSDKLRMFSGMNSPENCFVRGNIVCDTEACGSFIGTGIRSGGLNFVIKNEGCNNDRNFSYGVPNVAFIDHPYDTAQPYDNLDIPQLS